jgi:hypothetical protein
MPHVDLRTDSAARGTAELLRAGRGVLLDFSGRLAGPYPRARVARWAGRVDGVAAAAPLDLPDLVLLRPDGYVAWVGDRYSDPRWQISRWFGRDPQ